MRPRPVVQVRLRILNGEAIMWECGDVAGSAQLAPAALSDRLFLFRK
jgi:hypothetical protein